MKEQRILLLGLGGVGYYLAKRLSSEGHRLTAIDSVREKVHRADGQIDARLIHGDSLDTACWLEANQQRYDYLIAVTDNDAVNILASLIAHRCGIQRKIARVRSFDLWSSQAVLHPKDLQIDFVIRPEELAAREIVRLLTVRSGNTVVDLARGSLQVLGAWVDGSSPLAGRTVAEISAEFTELDFQIVAIARDIETLIPSGNERIEVNDHVFMLTGTPELAKLMDLTRISSERRERVMVVGGGQVGSRIAELLQEDFRVTLIERDLETIDSLSDRLGKVRLLHGNGADQETLMTAGLLRVDTVITATGDNETNIMTSVLSKHLLETNNGASRKRRGKTIALVKQEQYLTLAAAMGADIVLDKKVLAGNEILKQIRRGELLSLAHIHGVEAEIVELVAKQGSPITRRPIHKLRGLAGRIRIGCVYRDREWTRVQGTVAIQAGEPVIGICHSAALPELEKLVLG